jgi:hypothetical protein
MTKEDWSGGAWGHSIPVWLPTRTGRHATQRRERLTMGQAIGQVLAFGIGVTLSPVPIIAVVLMLATPKGRVD